MQKNIISIKNLQTTIDNNVVHKDLNLDVRLSETLIVIGSSGCGKSVLFRSIVGLITPLYGSIIIDGVDITTIGENKIAKLRQKFGVLFQGNALFDSLNVYNNIAFPLQSKRLSKRELDMIVEEKLSLVGLNYYIKDYMPNELSMGVQKRVALARAIVMNPEIILYDEPTTGLDPLIAGVINELILHLQKELKVTSLVVTHDLKSAFTVGDRIAFLHDGIISVCGTGDEIRKTKNPNLQKFIDLAV